MTSTVEPAAAERGAFIDVPLALRTITGTAGVRMAITIMVFYNKPLRIPGGRILLFVKRFGCGSHNARFPGGRILLSVKRFGCGSHNARSLPRMKSA